MCGRFTLRTPGETLTQFLDGINIPHLVPRYNIAPTQAVLAVRESENQSPEAVLLRWGLVPAWSRDLKIGSRMINARAETAATKPSFRTAFKRRRCLILADGFYEWKKLTDEKQPYYITRKDRGPFCFAGLWESWIDKSSKKDMPAIETCTILTTTPNEWMATVHDRMPVILPARKQWDWIDSENDDPEELQKLMIPNSSDPFELFPVSKVVNKPAHDRPECIEPISNEE